ncbi:hypothetical protein NJ76_15630, partial [Rhodococcus sp. IITR03]
MCSSTLFPRSRGCLFEDALHLGPQFRWSSTNASAPCPATIRAIHSHERTGTSEFHPVAVADPPGRAGLSEP